MHNINKNGWAGVADTILYLHIPFNRVGHWSGWRKWRTIFCANDGNFFWYENQQIFLWFAFAPWVVKDLAG